MKTVVSSDVVQNGAQKIVATLHWPDESALKNCPPVMVCLPGGGYNRHYFDLPEPGYSQADHHAANGLIVIAMDHLAVGDSSIPLPEHAGLDEVASANHSALTGLLAKLRSGELGSAGPISLGPVIGVGQSMGGHIAVIMQAHHRSFDAIAVLGSSMVRTFLPSKIPWHEVHIRADADLATAGMDATIATDWELAFFWDDVPKHMVSADMSARPPVMKPSAPWSSATVPNASTLLLPAAIAREAAAVDVPVLIGMGERDVCRDPALELAAFQSARDIAIFRVPRMAHMHNFAGTRRQMWLRLEAFATQVASLQALE
jgi:pimeloyl-ACP methyl ester carboxylesterase